MLKLSKLTLTSSYQNLGVLLAAQTDRPFGDGRNLTNGLFTNTGAEAITLSVNKTGVGDDDTSNTIAVGESLPFTAVNLSQVAAKAASSASTLEISGDES